MNIGYYRYKDTDIMVLSLEGDLRTKIGLLEHYIGEIEKNKDSTRLVINQQSDDTKINSEILGLLLRLKKEKGRDIRLSGIRGSVEAYLKIKRLDQFFTPQYNTLEEAIQSYSTGA